MGYKWLFLVVLSATVFSESLVSAGPIRSWGLLGSHFSKPRSTRDRFKLDKMGTAVGFGKRDGSSLNYDKYPSYDDVERRISLNNLIKQFDEDIDSNLGGSAETDKEQSLQDSIKRNELLNNLTEGKAPSGEMLIGKMSRFSNMNSDAYNKLRRFSAMFPLNRESRVPFKPSFNGLGTAIGYGKRSYDNAGSTELQSDINMK